MRYRFARGWARAAVALGIGAFLGCVIAAILAAVLVPPAKYLLTAGEPAFLATVARIPGGSIVVAGVVGLLVGLVVATPFILAGQLVLVFLDQRRLLLKIHRRLEHWEEVREPPRRAERLRHR